MIISRIQYGLGNQLFQYAIGRRLAIELGTELKADLSWFTDHQHYPDNTETKREYLLQKFNIDIACVESSELMKFNPFWGRLNDKALQIYKHKFRRKYIKKGNIELWTYDNDQRQLWEDVQKIKGRDFYLKGFFLNYSFLLPIRETLIEEFTLPKEEVIQNSEWQVADKNTVFVHIRRGDYIVKRQHDLAVCNMDYYLRSIELIRSKVDSPFFVFFSDEPDWISEHFDLSDGYISKGNEPHQDLMLMKSCNHAIISNSTFSWWGAFLMENKDKVVIAPRLWNKEKPGENRFLFPAEWIKI